MRPSRQRLDFIGNIVLACGGQYDDSCHVRVQHDPKCLKEVLRALWKHSPLFVSWVALTRARGSFFPFESLDD